MPFPAAGPSTKAFQKTAARLSSIKLTPCRTVAEVWHILQRGCCRSGEGNCGNQARTFWSDFRPTTCDSEMQAISVALGSNLNKTRGRRSSKADDDAEDSEGE